MTAKRVDTVGVARALAAEVLVRVWEQQAFASAALDAELKRRPGIDPRDAGLATELVYGVLRTGPALDARIVELASRKTWSDDARVRAHVLMAAYTLAFLDRVPAFAAVSEGVAGARAAGGDRVGGFANAVLRRLAEAFEKNGRPVLSDAIVTSAPGWLRGALRRSLGKAGTTAYLAAGPVPPPIGICLAPGEDREAWIARLRAAAPDASLEAGKASPYAILVKAAGDVRLLPGHGDAWIMQEEGAQVVALAAGVKAGETVLDACAGRGNKCWLLGHLVGSEGAVDAGDLYAAKLAQLREGAAGRVVRATYPVDWTISTGEVPDGYDVVIVDAPCSGTGTLRRRPEIAGNRDAEDLVRLRDLQATIVRKAATRAKDGGRLLFAVCSVLRDEGEAVVERLLAPAPGEGGDVTLEAAPFEGKIARGLAGEASTLRLLPHVHGTDGFFLASFRVRRPSERSSGSRRSSD